MTTYRIEIYDNLHKKYITVYTGRDILIAKRMMNKPYNARYTRRLISRTEQIVYKVKSHRYLE